MNFKYFKYICPIKMTKRNVRFFSHFIVMGICMDRERHYFFKETQEGKDIGRYDSGTNFKEIRA